ncbi:MAG: TetR/AcrR family transcriptional regulator [Pseudomonadota bacterium]
MNLIDVPAKDAKADALRKIIAAAEMEFSERGFDGAGMKAIAARADVSQSLLHYHFGSKDKLYAAVIQTRSSLINNERLALLNAVDLNAADGLKNVFRAMFSPALGPSGGGRAYARIFAGLIAGNARDQALVKDNYDETAQVFIKAIQTCLPGIEPNAASHIYLSALGVLAMSLARDGRAARLVGMREVTDNEALVETLTCFAVGGAKAIKSR